MNTIYRASINDVDLLLRIGTASFLESHGHSASKEDIEGYVQLKFNKVTFSSELQEPSNHFYIITHQEIPVGYSKIIFNESHDNIEQKNVTKLERLYVLKEYHHLKLGLELFQYNMRESRKQNQYGMWLFVWTENTKAFNFYQKVGFKIVGSHDFKISETHSNPNHQMLLTY